MSYRKRLIRSTTASTVKVIVGTAVFLGIVHLMHPLPENEFGLILLVGVVITSAAAGSVVGGLTLPYTRVIEKRPGNLPDVLKHGGRHMLETGRIDRQQNKLIRHQLNNASEEWWDSVHNSLDRLQDN